MIIETSASLTVTYTADEVYQVLARYEPQLMAVHLKAWDRLVSNAAWPTLIFQRTASSMMHDFIVQEAAATLDELSGIRRIAHDKSVRYLVEEKVLFRFKRGTPSGLGSNIDTQANDAFIDAEIELPGIPAICKVELLWYPNRLRTKLDRIEVSARNLNRRLWSYTLGSEPDIATLPLDLPVAPARPAVSLVTIKGQPKKNEDKK